MSTTRFAPAAAVAVLAGLLVSPAAASAASARFMTPKGNSRAIDLAASQDKQDVRGAAYQVRAPDGSSETVTVAAGYSIHALLDIAGIDPYDFTYLEIPRAGGGAVRLSRRQATSGGATPPVVFSDGDQTRFLRPATGGDDANGADAVAVAGDLTLQMRKGELITVKATAEPRRIEPGESVTFTATGSAGSGERQTYSWYFDDGKRAQGETVEHTYAEAGSYDAVVSLTTPGDEVGASGVVNVQVGDPKAGPDRRGGGEDDDATAPESGTAAAGGSGGSTASAASADTGADDSAAVEPPLDSAQDKPAPASTKPLTSDPLRTGTLLSAESLAASPPAAASGPSGPRGARTGRPADDEGHSLLAIPLLAWEGLAVLGLLGLGHGLERRNRRSWLA